MKHWNEFVLLFMEALSITYLCFSQIENTHILFFCKHQDVFKCSQSSAGWTSPCNLHFALCFQWTIETTRGIGHQNRTYWRSKCPQDLTLTYTQLVLLHQSLRFHDHASSAHSRPPHLPLFWKRLTDDPKFPGSSGQVSTEACKTGSQSQSHMEDPEPSCPGSAPRKPPAIASVLPL